jgi:hypothetical protein
MASTGFRFEIIESSRFSLGKKSKPWYGARIALKGPASLSRDKEKKSTPILGRRLQVIERHPLRFVLDKKRKGAWDYVGKGDLRENQNETQKCGKRLWR